MKYYLIIIFLFSKSAVAFETGLSGKAYTDTYFSTQGVTSKTFLQQNLSALIQGDLKFSDKFSARGVYQGDYFDYTNSFLAAGYSQSTLRSQLREFYWQYVRPGFSVREGKQVISWGKSDGLNPTDFLSAKDYTFLNPDDELRRLAGTSVNTQWTPDGGSSAFTFQLVTQFVPPKGKALIPQASIPSGVTILNPATKAIALENTEVAFKTSYSAIGWDASLSFFKGFDHQPEFKEVSRTAGIVLQQYYSKVFAIGFDASKSWSDWVGRLEAAYFITENTDAQNALLIPSHFDIIMGAEKPFLKNWRLNTQVFIRYFPQYKNIDEESDPLNLQIARFNALLKQYQDKTRPSASLRLAYEPQESDLSFDIFLIYNFAGSDYLWRPQLRYKPIDDLKFSLGADYHGGDVNKPLGSLKGYNSIYFEAQYYF